MSAEAVPTRRLTGYWPLLAVLLALVAAFHGHFAWLVEKGWRNEYYGHGPLIPLVAAYLAQRRAGELRRARVAGHPAGLGLVAVGLALHLYCVHLDYNFPQGLALVIVLTGLTAWLYGWAIMRLLAFPLAYLLFAVPLGRVLVDVLAQPMQLLATRMAAGAAAFSGIPVRVDGTTIALPEYRFEVAVACSGLRSAIAMAALGALYAYMLQGQPWRRWLLFGLAAPAAVLANSLRIWLTLILARALGPAAADGFFHHLSGMAVFAIALGALWLIGRALGCSRLRDDA